MKKKIFLIISIILVVLGIIVFRVLNNKMEKITAVVVRADDDFLMIYGNGIDFCSCGLKKTGNIGFKMGQEIELYGKDIMVSETYPGQLTGVEKIKITKEQSNIDIPEEYIRYCYASKDKVNISVLEITPSGITYMIEDNNEYKNAYIFSDDYLIIKKNKEIEEENKQIRENNRKIIEEKEKEQKHIEQTNYWPSSEGLGLSSVKDEWEEVKKISNILSKDTGIYKNEDNKYIKKYDWTNLYGTLGEGEYKFNAGKYSPNEKHFEFTINFKIDENGQVMYKKPQISL